MGQRIEPGFIGAATADVFAPALTVSDAVACSFTVTVEELKLHVIWLEEGAQVNATAPLKLLKDCRFNWTVPELPACTVICGVCGASVKSPPAPICVAVMFTTLLTEGPFAPSPSVHRRKLIGAVLVKNQAGVTSKEQVAGCACYTRLPDTSN